MPDGIDINQIVEAIASRLATRATPVDFSRRAHTFRMGLRYSEGMVVHHMGGLWQAACEAVSPPGEIPGDWTLLTDGIRRVTAYPEQLDPRVFGVTVALSSGKTIDLKFRLPLPLHRGPFGHGVNYSLGDEVEHGGATYRAMHDAPGVPPNEGWLLVARGLRGDTGESGIQGETGERGPQGVQGRQGEPGPIGARGLQGERGPRGDQGPRGISVRNVHTVPGRPGLIRMELEDGTLTDPIAISDMRFVGVYEPGASYERGDVVRFGYHLWIAAERTDEVPTINSTAWVLFLTGVDPSGTGGGAGPPGSGVDPNLFVRKAGDTMTGALQVPNVATGVGEMPALAIGVPATGFIRQGGGNIVLLIGGIPIMSWDAGFVNVGNNRLIGVADPTAAQDATNRQYVDANYLALTGGTMRGNLFMGNFHLLNIPAIPLSDDEAVSKIYVDNQIATLLSDYLPLAGGQLTGPLVIAPGNFLEVPFGSASAPALMIGDNSTGFYRVGNTVILNVSGGLIAQFNLTQVQFATALNMSNFRLMNVAAPVAATDGVPRSYVDGASRAPSLMVTLPADVTTPDGGWTRIAPIGPFQIPRGGNSRIMVNVIFDCTYSGNDGQIVMAGVRINLFPTIVRRAFLYKTSNNCPGISVQFVLDVAGTTVGQFDVEIAQLLWATAASPAITVQANSQIIVADMGPR